MKKRKDCFLGMHFDFHAGDDCNRIGENTTEEMIQDIIDKVHPDFIQCDCKGHPGVSSYPTKVGNKAPGFIKDNLRIWKEVTKKNDVPLYLHYSGVWDSKAIKNNSEWARVNELGEKDENNTSVFGPYVDELLIPQIKELIDEYDINGIWIDGECWATCQDYSDKAIALFKERTGITSIPRKEDDKYYYEYTEFCRDGFREYLKHYVDEIHKYKAEFQIASNWAYSSFMPEKPSIDVDFISGDYTLADSYNSARFEGRCMANQGKAWDLMAWAFSGVIFKGIYSSKTPIQLKQEAAAVLSLGGGFQAYFTQKRDGSIKPWQMNIMSEVAKFCRSYEKYCFRSKPIKQVVILHSAYNAMKITNRLFSHWSGEMIPTNGIIQAILDNQYSLDIYTEQTIDYENTPVIVLPETKYLKEDTKNKILEYVKKGGKLLLIGPEAAEHFKEYLNVSYLDKTYDKQWLEYNGFLGGIESFSVGVKANANTKEIGKLYNEDDIVGTSRPCATKTMLGKGEIIATWCNFGKRYVKSKTPTSRDFIGHLIDSLFFNPIVKVKGSHSIDVVVNTKNNEMLIHLINTSGPHQDENIFVFDEILPINNIEIEVILDKEPEYIKIVPNNIDVDYKYSNNKVTFRIDSLEIYNIIRIK